MATTYTLISSNTLGSNAATVTFSSIPSTYTDLVLHFSVRTTYGIQAWDELYFQLNGDTATNYSVTRLQGSGSAATSSRSSSTDMVSGNRIIDGNNATANTFGNGEIYIPSYTVSQNKPLGIFGAQENNSATAYINANAGLWRNTATISSILLGSTNGGSFVTNSSFYLYGIKNS